MAATIKIKNSSTASAVPTSSDLVQGELAVNVTDKRIFTENASGTVVELGTNPSILTLPDGSASAPTLTNDGDTNTGIFFPAADTVGITTGGTERARVDSAGNMGLGVTPSAWATVKPVVQLPNGNFIGSQGSVDTFYVGQNHYYDGTNFKYVINGYATQYQMGNGNGQHQWKIAASGTAGNAISFTQAMTLDASGNLGVGPTSISSAISGSAKVLGICDPTNTNLASVRLSSGSTLSSGNRMEVFSSASSCGLRGEDSNPMVFFTAATERARIDSSGNLLVGRTSTADATVGGLMQPSGRIIGTMAATTNSTDTLTVYSTGAAAYRFYVGLGGTVYATSTTISAISDIRFKENVRDLDAGLAEVMALKPRLYDWKEGKGANIKNARGFIAQEFEEVFPDLIDEWRDPAPEGEEPYKSVRQDLIPVLVKAIQEQQAIITQLQADVAALKG